MERNEKKMDKICTFKFFSLPLPPEQVNFIKKERETLHLIIYMDCTRRELNITNGAKRMAETFGRSNNFATLSLSLIYML